MKQHRPIATATATATGLAVLALAGCGEDRGAAVGAPADPPPAASPQPAASQVPGDFPLTAGLPERNGDDGSPVEMVDRTSLGDLVLCGEALWTADGTADVAGAVYTGEAEDVRSRTLALYPDSTTAAAALQGVRDVVAACPEDAVGGTAQVYEEVEGEDDSAVITHRYRGEAGFDTGLETLGAHRVGNALLVATYYGEANGSPESLAAFLRFGERSTAPVVRAMRIFADEPDGPDETDRGRPIPDDFPLADGWPEDSEGEGVRGPGRQLESWVLDTYDVCGRTAPRSESGERLVSTWAGLEDYRGRTLISFADDRAAARFVAALRASYVACTEEGPTPDSAGQGERRVVGPTDRGEESFAMAALNTQRVGSRDHLGIWLLVVQTTRVGHAVLVESADNHGGGHDLDLRSEGVRRTLAEMDAGSADVVAAMADLP